MAVDPKTLNVGDILEDQNTEDVEYLRITSIGHTPDKKRGTVFFDCGLWCEYGMDKDEDEWWVNINLANLYDCCNGSKVAGHPRFLALLDQLRTMHNTKSADYGTADDIFSNFRGSSSLGVAPWVGAMIRAKDKVRRIESFVSNGVLKNEPLIDSFLDLASYALIAAVLFEEEQTK